MDNIFLETLRQSSLSHEAVINGRNSINFFICSAFEDFETERKILSTRIFPKLRSECFNNFGIEISLIDLKLGIDARHQGTESYRHLFTEYLERHGVCDQNNCPIFLFGQKYGRPQIPNRIPIGIYELFKKTLRRYKNRFPVDPLILDEYYKLSTNSMDSEMILRSAVEMFPQLVSKDPKIIKEVLDQWTESVAVLSNLFKNLSNICLSNGNLDLPTVQNLLLYELDTSVSQTLRRSLNSNFKPIIYSREIIDIKNFIVLSNDTKNEDRKSIIGKLIDITYEANGTAQVDYNSQVVLEQLVESCLEVYESVEQPVKILWRDRTGVAEEHHSLYIEEMISFFTSKIYEAVSERAEYLVTELRSSPMKCLDIVCDANLQIKRLAKLCSGFEEIVSALLAYVNDESEHVPMFLFGPPNSGKAIILAKTIREFQQMNYDVYNGHVITRFVNAELSLDEVLLSIYYQMKAILSNQNTAESLNIAYNDQDDSLPRDLDSIFMYFQHEINTKFIIILYDLEKASNLYSSGHVDELIPKTLPMNVKLIVTTTESWDNRQMDTMNLSVPEFSITEYNNFILTQLSHNRQTLTESQMNHVLQPCLMAVSDIFSANLLLNYLENYRFFDSVDAECTITSVDEIVVSILQLSMKRYGDVLITHLLGLLYCSNGGLTNDEIVDMLTMDNDVIKEMTIMHPYSLIIDRDNLKFPLALLLLIRYELSVMFVEKIRDGYVLLNLANESIFLLLQQTKPEINLESVHKLLAEYYLGLWFSSKRIYFDDKNNSSTFNCLPRQQLMLSKSGEKIFYNYRKLRQLAYHLVESKMNDKLLEEVIFNFDWLYYKIKSLGIMELLEDFKFARGGSKEIVLLEESFRNSAATIDKELDSLAGELIGQLLPYVPFYPNLRLLIENCDTVAPKHNAFIPIYPNNKLPGSPLASTIGCLAAIESVKIVRNLTNESEELLLKVKDDCNIYFYDLNQGLIVGNTLVSHGIVYFGPNPDNIFVLEAKFRQIIKVHNRLSGDLTGQIIPLNWIVPRPFENKHDYRIMALDIGCTKAALIITNEVSYLFIVSLDNFEPILAFNPGVKLQMLKLSVDETKVFSHHGEKLISFEISTNKTNSAVELQGNPIQMIFSISKFNKAFIICDEQRGVVVLELDQSGGVNKCYKISFDNCLDNDDYVRDLSCSRFGSPFLLIRSSHSVLLYDWKREKILCHVTRPVQLPVYFKLPNQNENQPASLHFNAATLILNDRVLACSLFRDVILCSVADNRVLTTLHAPVGGIVSELFVTDQFLIGRVDQNEESAEIMIWRMDTSSLFSKIETLQDRLTKSVREIHAGPSVAIATCDGSDEMGVIEISTGTLVDLYSHASNVMHSCLSICGKYALVTVDNSQNSNILWSLESRKIILEFGNSINTVFLVQLKSISGFLVITNYSVSVEDPLVTVTQINCADGADVNSYVMRRLEVEQLKFITERPCIVNEDKILVALSNDYYRDGDTITCQSVITIWSRDDNYADTGVSLLITVGDLSQQIGKNLSKIVSLKSSMRNENKVTALCTFVDDSFGSLLLDCGTGTVLSVIDIKETIPTMVDFKEVFLSNSGIYLFDQRTLSIVNLITGTFVGTVPCTSPSDYQFQCFALRDTVVVVSHRFRLVAWRLPEFIKIGHVELKDEVTCVSKCDDDFTLLVGCRDGSIVSYAIVDAFSPYSGLSKIRVVRNFRPMSKSPTIELESTDQLKEGLLSSTMMSMDIAQIRRPMSDPIVGLDRRDFSSLF